MTTYVVEFVGPNGIGRAVVVAENREEAGREVCDALMRPGNSGLAYLALSAPLRVKIESVEPFGGPGVALVRLPDVPRAVVAPKTYIPGPVRGYPLDASE